MVLKMGKICWKGGALLAPIPAVLVTSFAEGKTNVLTVAWTGTVNTQPPKTYISVRKSRYSHELISKSREFVINLTTEEMAFATDFCGVRSGRDLDKLSFCHLQTEPASQVQTPLLSASPVSIECRVSQILELGSHDLFLADIVAVDVREDLLDENGRLALEKAGLLAYVHGQYFGLGKKIGKFGYSVEKKKRKGKRPTSKK
jgi:flavin reductase (DIM6/NTAB) family NADH-FMN oxidoreductase RutF